LIVEHLPAAAAELNAVERFFEQLRKELSNHIFQSIEEVENKISELLKK
jgi:regulator of PEP synthase PpsR (kinase-PPPase family)